MKKLIAHKNLDADQQGFVALMVTMIIMTILSLIVIGFITLVTREQRQVLDRQLSTQAFYAAEAGVNDAISYLHNGGADQPNCGPIPGYNNRLDATGNISYSCAIIDKSPLALSYDAAQDKSLIIPLKTATPIQDIVISWQDTGTGATPTPSTSFINDPTHNHPLPPVSDPSVGTGMVRAMVMPFSPGNNRDNLIDRAASFFLFPNSDLAGTSSVAYSQNGSFIDGNCSITATRPRYCQAIISGVSSVIGSTNVAYLRIKAMYKPVSVHIQVRDASGTFVPLSDAQAVVDVTGKASDVLRRIQVNIPLVNGYNLPEAALQSLETICKRMVVWNGGAFSDAPSDPLLPASEAKACDVPSIHTGVSATVPCGPPLCSTDPLTERRYYWDIYRVNSTDSKGLGITGCLWDFGDGKTRTDKCNPGDFMDHVYEPPPDLAPYPAACFVVGVAGRRYYEIRLTTNYSNGTSDTAIVHTYTAPYCIDPP